MATVTVRFGAKCASGGHQEILVFEDARQTGVVRLEASKLLLTDPELTGAIKTPEDAVARILAESKDVDLATVKLNAERKSVVLGETKPRDPQAAGGQALGSR